MIGKGEGRVDLGPIEAHLAQMKSAAVDVKTASQVRTNLKAVLNTVTKDRIPVIISREKGEPVVMVPLAFPFQG